MSDWEFTMSADGGWQWRQLTPGERHVQKSSARAFPTLLECMSDAEAHGYTRGAESEQALARLRNSACGRELE